ncbi:MAG TPA: hypothetical protein VE028_10195 [Nitratidesulfovibrio sp.]|nr:hypothetical protein [Nitratidesulfovibrio sp.]
MSDQEKAGQAGKDKRAGNKRRGERQKKSNRPSETWAVVCRVTASPTGMPMML